MAQPQSIHLSAIIEPVSTCLGALKPNFHRMMLVFCAGLLFLAIGCVSQRHQDSMNASFMRDAVLKAKSIKPGRQLWGAFAGLDQMAFYQHVTVVDYHPAKWAVEPLTGEPKMPPVGTKWTIVFALRESKRPHATSIGIALKTRMALGEFTLCDIALGLSKPPPGSDPVIENVFIR